MTAKAFLQSAGDGTEVPAGSVGEKIEYLQTASFTQSSAANGTIYDPTSWNITLTPGVWRLSCALSISCDWSPGGTNVYPACLGYIRQGSTVIASSAMATINSASTINITNGNVFIDSYVSISSSTVYKASISYTQATGGSMGTTNLGLNFSTSVWGLNYLRAIRIA